MIIYQDVITGDEILSDSYPFRSANDDSIVFTDEKQWEEAAAVIYVDTQLITLSSAGDVDIGCGNAFGGKNEDDEEEKLEDGATKAINIVHNHQLVEIPFTKAEFKTLFLDYLKRTKAAVKSNPAKTQRLKNNVGVIQEWMKGVLKNFDDYCFYTGSNGNPNGLIIPALYIGEAVAPRLFYITDALIPFKS